MAILLRGLVARDLETSSAQYAVIEGKQIALDGGDAPDGGERLGLKVREGVEQRGDKHVAGSATNRIYVDMHGLRAL